MLRKDSLLIFFIGVVVFTVGLCPEFLGLDARFGLFAQEMLRNGPTFFPTTYGQPYPDYPAASTFLIYLASLPFGKVTPFTTILPMAVVSALILVVTYRIGALHSRQWGLWAVALTLFTKEFFGLSRSLSPDQYVSLATVVCFYLAYSADVCGGHKRRWCIPPVLIGGFAFRGPIGLVVPAAVLCGYYLYDRNFKKFVVMAVLSAVLLAACFKCLLLAAVYQGGAEFAQKVWKMQMAGRMQMDQHGFSYYWVQSFLKYAIVYPFAVIVVVSRWKEIFRRETTEYKFLGYLAVWTFIVLLGMSIPGAKKIRYIVPMVPAAALIASYIFIAPVQKDILSGTKKLFLGFCVWFPAGAFVGIAVLWGVVWQRHLAFDAYYAPTLAILLILAVAARRADVRMKEGFAREMALAAVGAATFVGILVGIAEPITYHRERTGPFVAKVLALQSQRPGDIVFYKISADSDAIKFMVNLDKPVRPDFIDAPEAILNCKVPAYFIAREKDFARLPQAVAQKVNVVDRGTISHGASVVFTRSD